MRERKSNMLGDVVRMEALNAGQNIGAVNYIDQDDFYPASGVSVDERGDIDTIDMVYDHSENDLSPTADYFDGDYQNSYADGEEDDYDDFDDEDYDDFDDDDEDDFDGEDDYEDFDDEDYDDFDDEDDYDDFDDEDEEFDGENDYDNFDDEDPYDTEAEWGEFEGEDDIDMDESTGDYNDLSSGGFDFFEGGDPELDADYNNFDSDTYSEVRGRRRRKSGGIGSTLKGAIERRFGEEGQERAEKRREDRRARREDRREGRRSKREERQAERRERREERQSLRAKKKLAKIGEVEARNEATRALSQQPAEDPTVTQMMQNLNTKSAPTTPEKKGLSTGAIVGISLGALALVGGALFLILRKK